MFALLAVVYSFVSSCRFS